MKINLKNRILLLGIVSMLILLLIPQNIVATTIDIDNTQKELVANIGQPDLIMTKVDIVNYKEGNEIMLTVKNIGDKYVTGLITTKAVISQLFFIFHDRKPGPSSPRFYDVCVSNRTELSQKMELSFLFQSHEHGCLFKFFIGGHFPKHLHKFSIR